MKYYECSAKTGKNVNEVFDDIGMTLAAGGSGNQNDSCISGQNLSYDYENEKKQMNELITLENNS